MRHIIHTFVSNSLRKHSAWGWALALALLVMQIQPASAQNTLNSPITIQNGGDLWLQSALNGKYPHLIGTYAGWDPSAVYLGGYNATNRAGDPVNKVIVGGSGSTLPLYVTGAIYGQSLSIDKGGVSALNVTGNWGGSPTEPVANIVAFDGSTISGGVAFNKKLGALNFDLLNVYYQGSSKLLVNSNGQTTINGGLTINGATNVADGRFEIGGSSPSATNGHATLTLHHYSAIAHQLRYTSGTLFLEASGVNGYGTNGTPNFAVGGNVLIGKTSQTNGGYRLDVNGSARANEIIVNTTGADFVFEKGYPLMPLSAVESFIKENGHLPEVASAKEMQENGAAVGEMQTKLLQKVEELTLHLIEQNKRIERLETENQALKQRK